MAEKIGVSLTQLVSSDELLFLFEQIDDGNRVDISNMENKTVQKNLKKLFKEYWKLSKNRDGYVKKKKCKRAPQSCRIWYENILRELGIQKIGFPIQSNFPPLLTEVIVPPPPPPPQLSSSIGPSIPRKKKKKNRNSRGSSLFEIHQKKLNQGRNNSTGEEMKSGIPEYKDNPYNPDKIRKRRQEIKAEELGRMTLEEKEKVKKSGYLMFSKTQVSDTSNNEKKDIVEKYKKSIQRSFRPSKN